MGRERNVDSIRAIEKQITEHETVLAKLKRTRNSLADISTLVPPEILGNIFYWTVILEQERLASRNASYSFLFVCYRWFEVASRTPQLWTSWGNSLRDWERRFTCPRAPRLDLELTRGRSVSLDEKLRDALQDRAGRDFIRRVKLTNGDSDLLNSIVSSITPSGEGIQSSNLESFELQTEYGSESAVELSQFFSRYHLPKLRHLRLSGSYNVSSWDSLASRTTALTTLSLRVGDGCPTPTPSQFLSILSSNPNLQHLELSDGVLPDFNRDRSSFQVQLRCLKHLHLSGDSQNVLGLLDRLVPADKMDRLQLTLFGYSASDISQTLGRYLGDNLRRRGKLKKGLAVGGNCAEQAFFFKAGDVDEFNNWRHADRVNWFMEIMGVMPGNEGPKGMECEKSFLDLLTHMPHDHIVCYESPCRLLKSAGLSIGMTNLVVLRPNGVHLTRWFAEPDFGETHAYGELLPSLKYLSLVAPTLSDGDWSPLITFLSSRASAGNRLHSLTISECSHMCQDVVEDIKRVIESFEILWSLGAEDLVCPRGKCPERGEDQQRRGLSYRNGPGAVL